MQIGKSTAPRVLLVIFAILASVFLARGLTQILSPSSGAHGKDLRTNWEELRAVIHRHNPYGGIYVTVSPYPAYTFVPNLVLYWPPWPVCPAYFVLINLICLACVARWAYLKILPVDRDWAMAAGSSILAMSAISTGIGLGQNPIIYTTLLVATLALDERGRPLMAGLLLGISM